MMKGLFVVKRRNIVTNTIHVTAESGKSSCNYWILVLTASILQSHLSACALRFPNCNLPHLLSNHRIMVNPLMPNLGLISGHDRSMVKALYKFFFIVEKADHP